MKTARPRPANATAQRQPGAAVRLPSRASAAYRKSHRQRYSSARRARHQPRLRRRPLGPEAGALRPGSRDEPRRPRIFRHGGAKGRLSRNETAEACRQGQSILRGAWRFSKKVLIFFRALYRATRAVAAEQDRTSEISAAVNPSLAQSEIAALSLGLSRPSTFRRSGRVPDCRTRGPRRAELPSSPFRRRSGNAASF